MTDDFEAELRESLAAAVPTPPEEPDRAAGARGYARQARRTKIAFAVSAVAVSATAVILVPSVVAGPTTSNQVAHPGGKRPDTQPSSQVDPACPASAGFARPTDVELVPLGAIGARLCPAESDRVSWSAPNEILVQDVDGLVKQVNALPVGEIHGCLPMSSLPSYNLVFQYPGGRRVIVTAQVDCDYVSVGRVVHEGAFWLLQHYLDRLNSQRASAEPPAEVTGSAPSCPSDQGLKPTTTVLVDGLSLRTARICIVTTSLGEHSTRTGTLTAYQIEVLDADLAAHRSRIPRNHPGVTACLSRRGGDISTYEIVGTSTWGDQVRLTGTCRLFSYTDRSGDWHWVPSPAVSAMLASAARPTGQITGRL